MNGFPRFVKMLLLCPIQSVEWTLCEPDCGMSRVQQYDKTVEIHVGRWVREMLTQMIPRKLCVYVLDVCVLYTENAIKRTLGEVEVEEEKEDVDVVGEWMGLKYFFLLIVVKYGILSCSLQIANEEPS